ncbi:MULTISPECIES: SCO4225 family membrane protein [unclassified Streptomyces]|uniref:SCO4225 family membrane protein n=1 Tax=unclassified Streptomyces TaxID=2593676 RepID=UPI00340C22BC
MTGTDSDTDTDSGRSVLRRLRDHVGAVGLAYLGVCAVLLVWALVVTAGESTDASVAGVIPLLATAPASLVLLVLPDNSLILIPAIALGAAVNAAIIGWCTRALRRGGRTDQMD